mmetsp:Transcript_10369/g.15034  ORF Transcript_10369/g.15034 Transcript_10369/m.15034 type:complete len:83 (+) Transcript_10369:1364-1612(+)
MRPSGGVLTRKAASAVLGRDDEGPQATLRVISGTPCFISSSLHCIFPWMIRGRGFGEHHTDIELPELERRASEQSGLQVRKK